jgi:UDP-N-acetyl-D-galactosamine dehydrogenase
MVHDPRVNSEDAEKFFGIKLCEWEDLHDLGAMIFAVPHQELLSRQDDIIETLAPQGCLIDVKSVLDVEEAGKHAINFWRL